MRTKKRKRKTGSSLLLALCVCATLCQGADKKSKEKAANFAVVAGTVFRDPGFALPGATLTLTPRGEAKPKKLQAAKKTTSDGRGEFSFRVSAAPATYLVKASLKGFHPEEKEAAVGGEGRVDVTFTLVPESK